MFSTCPWDNPCSKRAWRSARSAGLVLLLLVLALQQGLPGDCPVAGNLLQTGHFPADHVQLLDAAEKLGLLLQEVFVRQADLKQRLPRLDRLALDGIDPRHRTRHGRRHLQRRPARTMDNDPGDADRALERAELHAGQAHADIGLGLARRAPGPRRRRADDRTAAWRRGRRLRVGRDPHPPRRGHARRDRFAFHSGEGTRPFCRRRFLPKPPRTGAGAPEARGYWWLPRLRPAGPGKTATKCSCGATINSSL